MATSVTFGILFLGLLSFGVALKCYSCKSAFNGKCDVLNTKEAVTEDCEQLKLLQAYPQVGQQYVCVLHRMAQKESNAEVSVVRGCAPNNYCTSFPGSTQCDTCTSDYCNATARRMPSVLTSLLSLILCVRYYM